MLDDCKDNRERWQAVEGLLQSWLKERRDVLVKYTTIAAILESRADRPPLEFGLQGLCQVLVDYVSAGHFEIFHELIREAEAFADGSDKLAGQTIRLRTFAQLNGGTINLFDKFRLFLTKERNLCLELSTKRLVCQKQMLGEIFQIMKGE